MVFKTKHPHYPSIDAWVQAGSPTNSYVHDSVDALTTAGIPIVDCVVLRGMYIKTKRGKPEACKVNTRHAFNSTAPVFKKKVKGIFDADTRDHHKMSY
ncbi:hypothetical protein [Burkholderia phage BCSR5]|nr:hypothetical protein [Burkholderia phage BCSR5]